jgi:hypothetical protein
MADRGERFNASGCYDPTPYQAIKNIEREEQLNDERGILARKVIKTLQNMAHLAGFDIVGRITLLDKKTGKEWR